MTGEVWADIVSQHDNKLHHAVDIACAALIGISVGGLFVYWQMASLPVQTKVIRQIQTTTPRQTQGNTGQGTVEAPLNPQTPKVQDI